LLKISRFKTAKQAQTKRNVSWKWVEIKSNFDQTKDACSFRIWSENFMWRQ